MNKYQLFPEIQIYSVIYRTEQNI